MGLIVHHAKTAPTPPSARSELPIPEALDRLVMACLEKDPAARPQTARELSHRLAAIDGSSPSTALGINPAATLGVHPWTDERARAWWATHEPASPSIQS